MAYLVLDNVWKTYQDGQVTALAGIHLAVQRGQFVTVLGPSGCGKTTLLHVIAGLQRPDRGKILLDGRDITGLAPRQRNVAMVFQNYALYPHMKVFDNIAVPLRLRRYARHEIEQRVQRLAAMLGIEAFLDRYPRQLSGGQQQRVALARALVREPALFLLDEPLSNLDAKVREATRAELKGLFHQLGATVIYVTHDQTEALTLSDVVVVMDAGRVRQVGTPEAVYRDPQHRFVAEFVGSPRINWIAGDVRDGQFTSRDATFRFNTGLSWTGAVQVGIRPEYVRLAEDRGDRSALRGTVTVIEPMGHVKLVHVQVGDQVLRALVATERPLHRKQTVAVDLRPDTLLYFDPHTGQRIPQSG